MTNGVLSATVGSGFAKQTTTTKEGNVKNEVAKEPKTQTKVEQLKNAVANGEYKIDIDALAKKMAEELIG